MSQRAALYEGKAKIIYPGPDQDTLIQYFKDDATAFNAQKKEVIGGKGILNNLISEHIMLRLASAGIDTHFIRRLDEREQLVRKLDIIPIEVIVRNVAAGSICGRLGLVEGEHLSSTLVEFCYKKDSLGDPVIAREHALVLGLATGDEIDAMMGLARVVNDELAGIFDAIGLLLVDFKLEFGRASGGEGVGQVILADEISPDNCRLWDRRTNEKMDKDRFRRDLGGLCEAYMEVAERFGIDVPDSVRAG